MDTIYSASEKGDLKALKRLLKAKKKELKKDVGAYTQYLDEPNEHRRTALILACKEGHLKVVEHLLKEGASITALDVTNKSALSWACQFGHLTVVKALLKAVPDIADDSDKSAVPLLLAEKSLEIINSSDDKGKTPLAWSVDVNRLDMVNFLVQKGARSDTPNPTGLKMTTLHVVSQDGRTEILEVLLPAKDSPLDLDIQDAYGNTPLHLACEKGHKDNVRLLLAAKANFETQNNGGMTPFHLACKFGHSDVVDLLVAGKVNIEAIDNYGRTALHHASSSGQVEIAEWLLDQGLEVDAQDNGWKTPLTYASRQGKIDVVKLLVEEGKAAVDDEDETKSTPLHYASQYNQPEVVGYLILNGADVHKLDKQGKTPLLRVDTSLGDSLPVISVLLKAGAQLTQRDKNGYSLLHNALLPSNVEKSSRVINHILSSLLSPEIKIIPRPAAHKVSRTHKGLESLLALASLPEGKASLIEACDEHNKSLPQGFKIQKPKASKSDIAAEVLTNCLTGSEYGTGLNGVLERAEKIRKTPNVGKVPNKGSGVSIFSPSAGPAGSKSDDGKRPGSRLSKN